MTRLENLTRHWQGAAEYDHAAKLGYELTLVPSGVNIGPEGLEVAAMQLAGNLASCARHGAAVLIGGHTALWLRAMDILTEKGCARPALFYFERSQTGNRVLALQQTTIGFSSEKRKPGASTQGATR